MSLEVQTEESAQNRPGFLARLRSFPRAFAERMRQVRGFLGKIVRDCRDFFGRAVALAVRTWRAFVEFTRSLQTSPRARYLTLVWVFFALFVGTALLSASNPLRLLIPGLPFPVPSRDARPTSTLYAVTAADRMLVPIRRRIQPSADKALFAKRVLFALTRPPAVQVQESDDFRDMIPLPNLGPSVRGIWYRPSGELVIDLRSASLHEDLRRTAESRRPARTEADYMDAFIRSYARSVFAVLPEVKTIRYLIDGERKPWQGLNYDLKEPVTREWLNPAPPAKAAPAPRERPGAATP